MRRKKWISLVVIGSLILSLTGCAGESSGGAGSKEIIDLVEPVSDEVNYEEAQIRTLYNVTVYAATVVPYVEEYSPENNMTFQRFRAYPGETVKKGQELVKSNTDALDEEIKRKQEYIASMEEEYQKYVETQTKTMEAYREDEAVWKYYVDKNEKNEPEKFITVPSETDPEGTVRIENPEHATWEAGYNMVTGRYRIAKHAADTVEMQMEQRRKLYELDLKHQQYLLKELQNRRKLAGVEAGMSGTVVATKDFYDYYYNYFNPSMNADDPVVAVADLSKKFIRCNDIPAATIKKALDVYAVIDGKRYEVEYQAISAEERKEILARRNKVYSTFTIIDEDDEVEIGDYAVITVVANRRENVVTIPQNAVGKDAGGNYVYVIKDGQQVYTSVHTGLIDGYYTEIIDGLEVGDKVVCASAQTAGKNTVVLQRGEFYADFSATGWMDYPSGYSLANPVENGTVYFDESKVKLYQHVDKGDVIATVRVEADPLSLRANQTRLTRLQERLADYKKDNAGKEDQDYYIDTVKIYEEQIKDLTEEIAKQNKDFATTQIVADRTGVIVGIGGYEKESIVPRNANLVNIADESTCYVVVKDENHGLQFGNSVQIKYRNAQGQQQTVEGMVATMSPMGVSSDLINDYVYILLPADRVEDVMQLADSDNVWFRDRYTVNAKLRSMENALLVPRSAVYDLAGKTYVYVKDENGNLKLQSFVAGGSNVDYYFVIEGLTEGMEVCLK